MINWWLIADVLLYLTIIEIVYVIILQKDRIGNVRAFKDKKWEAIGLTFIPLIVSLTVTLVRAANENGCSNPTGCMKPDFLFWNDLFFMSFYILAIFLIIVFFVKYYFELNVTLGKKINKKHIEKFEKDEEEFHRKREEEKQNGIKD